MAGPAPNMKGHTVPSTLHYCHAIVIKDHLDGNSTDDEVGAVFTMLPEFVGPTINVSCQAFDDDDELYYTLDVTLPEVDPYQEYALGELLNALGRHAGVTAIRFAGRPDLDCS